MSEDAALATIRLDCRPGRSGKLLKFPYRLENRSTVSIYAMDAYPWLDPETQELSANDQTAVVVQHGEKEAVVGKLLPIAPLGRHIGSPWFPLAKELKPGEAIEREFSVPTPLAETSPLLPDLRLREYEVVELEAVIFAVCYWFVGTPELYAAPESFAPDYLRVVARDPVAGAKLVWQRFPVRNLQLFRRTDAIQRTIGV
jgi:hypothetical protein